MKGRAVKAIDRAASGEGLPAVVERFGQHLAGVPMVGDPVIDATRNPDTGLVRRACQYAAAMVFGGGADLRAVDACFVAPATVVFVKADASQAEIARFTVPDRVMRFDPHAQPRAITGRREGE